MIAASRLVLDRLPRAITVLDGDGMIVGWNQVSEHSYGWTSAEAVGRSMYELMTPPDLRVLGRSIVETVLKGESWSGPVTVVLRDGTTRSTSSFLSPLRSLHGEIIGVVCAADDAAGDDDVRRLEKQADVLSEHLLLALEAGQLGTWQWTKATGVTVWNVQMERLFGLEPGTFEGTYDAWVALLHPDDVHHSIGVLDQAVADQGSYAVEHRVVWPDGSEHWLQGRGKATSDEAGNVTGTLGCSIDVTDLKLAEAAAATRINDAESAVERERLQRERIEFLVTLNDIALVATDHTDLMRRIGAAAVPRLGDWCAVYFRPRPGAAHERVFVHVDPAKTEWATLLSVDLAFDPNSTFGVASVMRTGRTEFVSAIDHQALGTAIDATHGDDPERLRSVRRALQLTSTITVPLITKRGIVGAIQFVSAESGRHYDADDQALAEAAAGRVAEAIDNAWLVEQQRNIAVTLQAALLPSAKPAIAGATVAVRYWATGAVSEVGGDFYDVFQIEDGAWAIVIGDVCGTGAKAASVTATARHTIRAAAMHGASPTEVLNWVNDAVRASGFGLFCTVLYSTLTRSGEREWTYTSAAGGHPLPILVDGDGLASMLGTPGTLIGVVADIDVTVSTTVLGIGSALVLHTDGVNDVAPPHGLDDAMMLSMVAAASASGGTAELVAERLGSAIAGVLPIAERDDDMAIVVVRLG